MVDEMTMIYGGRILQEVEKWREYTWAKEKMGEYTLAPGYEQTPPQGVFGTFP